jgi:hypothetical protein
MTKKNYLLEPEFTKCVVEREFWSDSDEQYSFTIDQHYRWLELFVECAEKPVIEVDDIENQGVNIVEYLESKYPGCNVDNTLHDCYASNLTEYSRNIPEDLLEKIRDFGDNRDELEEDGWDYLYTEIWVYTKMTVTEK